MIFIVYKIKNEHLSGYSGNKFYICGTISFEKVKEKHIWLEIPLVNDSEQKLDYTLSAKKSM